jgi:hypothetical protein
MNKFNVYRITDTVAATKPVGQHFVVTKEAFMKVPKTTPVVSDGHLEIMAESLKLKTVKGSRRRCKAFSRTAFDAAFGEPEIKKLKPTPENLRKAVLVGA